MLVALWYRGVRVDVFEVLGSADDGDLLGHASLSADALFKVRVSQCRHVTFELSMRIRPSEDPSSDPP